MTVEKMIHEGHSLPPLVPLTFGKGQGTRQTDFLCYSSGTSGQPKAIMNSHYNVIAESMQHTTYESVGRAAKGVGTQVLLAPSPLSHTYALIVAAHVAVWRGYGYIVLPKYDLSWVLDAVQHFKVQQMLMNLYADWKIGQAYGMTKTSVCVSIPSEHDMAPSVSGSLLPGTSVKLLDDQGMEITTLDQTGEILVQAPSVALGYLQNEKANAATFIHDDDGRWIRPGDVGLMSRTSWSNEQLVMIDRIKELIKGYQVVPAELEAHLLEDPAVADCAVIQIPDDRAGEDSKAFVVKSSAFPAVASSELAETLSRWVIDHKAPYKALRGSVEFVDFVAKSPSGKILRRLVRYQDAEKRAKASLEAAYLTGIRAS